MSLAGMRQGALRVIVALGLLAGALHLLKEDPKRATTSEPAAAAKAEKSRPPLLLSGGKYRLTKALAPICKTREVLDRIAELSGDREALEKIAAAAFALGDCEILEADTVVFVEESSVWSDRVRVRRKGDVQSFWGRYSQLEAGVREAE